MIQTQTFAQIIGPVLVAAAIGFVLHPKFYKAIMKDFEKHEGLTYFTGILTMLMGFIIVLNHNIWEASVAGIITFLGWGALIKGATFLIAPSILYSMSKPIIKNENLMKFAMIVLLAIGGYFSYFGYFA